MTGSDVTREGLRDTRPEREARTWEQGGRRRRRRRGAERAMVPEAEFRSYYDRPVIKPPVWKPDIPAYFFLGGVAAGSSMLAAGADLTERPALRRQGRFTSLAAITASTFFLIHDLGRPGRFAYMLRVFRPSSPMSLGSWLLALYGPAAGLAALGEATAGVAERRHASPARSRAARLAAAGARPAGAVAAALSPALATYTAVLLSDTAVPAWHDADPELPFVFAASAAAASGGLALSLVPADQAAPARRAAVAGGLVELAAAHRMERRMGLVGEPYSEGVAGRWMSAAEKLTAAGVVGTLVLGRRSRVAASLPGLALVAGSVCTRFGAFAAGMQSAKDPRHTVVPQRERVQRHRDQDVSPAT
jgi:hypothetical protein